MEGNKPQTTISIKMVDNNIGQYDHFLRVSMILTMHEYYLVKGIKKALGRDNKHLIYVNDIMIVLCIYMQVKTNSFKRSVITDIIGVRKWLVLVEKELIVKSILPGEYIISTKIVENLELVINSHLQRLEKKSFKNFLGL